MPSDHFDAVVVGAGPNGLAAAVTLARAGRSVCLVEASDIPGGALRSDEATLPGYIHDTCAAVFPMARGTPFFSSLPEKDLGVQWITPPAALAHPFDDGTCLLVSRSLEATAASLGVDAGRYERLVRPFSSHWQGLTEEILRPMIHVPQHPVLFSLFGVCGIWPVSLAARCLFKTEKIRALFAGLGAHSIMPLESELTMSFALFMAASAHATGWPLPAGGAARIAHGLAGFFQRLGGTIILGKNVVSLQDLPLTDKVLFDLGPHQISAIAGARIPGKTRDRLERFRYGPGVFKVDWALDGPIPWKAEECLQAGTLHLGGSLEEIALSERQVWQGIHPERPFVLCSQPSLFDGTRAPSGRHTAWAYCHVPHGSDRDMTKEIEDQVERFAPGFSRRILARRVIGSSSFERINANLVGGDIAGGANTFSQVLFRPVPAVMSYNLGPGIFICSASSPPGGGVHGMCGFNAAERVLADDGSTS